MKPKKLLYESFERNLSDEEKNILKEALGKSESLREEKEKLLKLRELISSGGRVDFKNDFEDKVIERIYNKLPKVNKGYIFFESLSLLFKRIVYITIVVVIISLSYNFTKSGNISLKSALGIKQQQTTLLDSFYNNLYSFFK